MTDPVEFDVFACPLDGINLIEASAGTGKTWNICGLYLRLLLERGLEVPRILVVTFTNAATAELRERIRARLVETLAWLTAGGDAAPSADPFVPRLVAAVVAHTGVPPAQLARTLDAALQYFDEAAIFTIHGFCQRALADAAFRAGLPFSLELVTDDREMVLDAVHDFWRRRVAADGCPPALAEYLLERGDTPGKFAELVTRSLRRPLAVARWPAAIDRAATLDTAAVTAACEAAGRCWAAGRDEIVACVAAALPGLNKGHYKDGAIERAAAAWDAFFRDAAPRGPFAAKAKPELLSAAVLVKRTNKGKATPSHPFFAAADALFAAREAIAGELALARMRLLRDLVTTVPEELRRTKRERRVIAFDDMLYNLHQALHGSLHPDLAGSLRERFPVALIDEFQDTDPLQFAIFDRLYGDGNLPAFFVGDPKQAIYSFRNADLHAYLRARQRATTEYTIKANQRSTPGLIMALNGLFSTKPGAFMLPGLDYREVVPGDRERKPFRGDGAARADLQVWTLPSAGDGQPVGKRVAQAQAADATAAEIARLLAASAAGRIAIGDRALRAADIAVLVRTHAQGSTLKHALARLGVGSVELSQASVFESPDAEEVERVLIAINEPSRDVLLRAALATEMMGCDAARVAEIAGSEADLMGYVQRFADYRDLWLRLGVGVMYRRFLTEQQVSARMLRRDDGERRLTNLLHLGEQIHEAAATHESPDALLRWLSERRRDGAADEVAQLRLESDRNLVRIVTVHKAKGLEFPIVFCPFLWDGRLRFGGPKPEGREYHDAAGTAVIDFRDDDEIGADAADIDAAIKRDDAAESLRLIYVALTRAVHRCYLIAGTYTIKRFANVTATESTKSLLNWLVAGGDDTPEQWFGGRRTPADIAAAWAALAARLGPHLAVAPLPAAPGTPIAPAGPAPETLAALPAPSSIARAWRLGSFSSLTSDAHGDGAADDHDTRIADDARRPGAPPADVAADDILRFPRGPSAGLCLHAMFERIDFTDPPGWRDGIDRGLQDHPQFLPGVRAPLQSAALAAMAARMLGDVMTTRLPDGIVLGSLPRARRLTELGFSLPSPRLSASALNGMLKRQGYDVPRLAFRDLEGYLRGFIDLVFEHDGRYYVLDWKSNHLGYAMADYSAAALETAMTAHGYHLQYLLYALAVDRYLRQRVPGYRRDAHFGGVLYLFVRGVRPDWADADGTPAGVFHHRPTAATLARLDALFAAMPAPATP